MIEKRINVSPPEAAISYVDGKLPPIFHVNIVTVLLDNGAIIGKQQNHRVEYTGQADGSFARNKPNINGVVGEPDADIEAALVAAEAKTQALIAALATHQGIMDYTTTDGVVVRYEKAGDLFKPRLTKA